MQPSNLSRLQPNERRAVETFVEALRRELDSRLLLLALFGSKARGDSAPGADIDFLVVTDGQPQLMEKRLSAIAAAVDLDCDVLVNVLAFSLDRWTDFARRRAAFWQNVQRDGMLLLRSPRLAEGLVTARLDLQRLPPDHRPEVSAYMAGAWQALRTAESQFIEARDYQVVADRAYYAIFYAANAALATRGLQRSNHTGVLALFRDAFVKTGVVETGFLRDYEEALKRRHMSDYDFNALVNADYVRVSLEAAQRFTSRVESLLAQQGFQAE